MPLTWSRRRVLAGLGARTVGGALATAAGRAAAQDVREIAWEDLIPPGVPYAEIVGQGFYDEATDVWRPEFDANATRVVGTLDGQRVRLPGYVVPLQLAGDGVTVFLLAPYAGACIHVPPPPANQLVFVTTPTPFPSESLYDAVWVTGTMRARVSTTSLAQVGYEMVADAIEIYAWEDPA